MPPFNIIIICPTVDERKRLAARLRIFEDDYRKYDAGKEWIDMEFLERPEGRGGHAAVGRLEDFLKDAGYYLEYVTEWGAQRFIKKEDKPDEGVLEETVTEGNVTKDKVATEDVVQENLDLMSG